MAGQAETIRIGVVALGFAVLGATGCGDSGGIERYRLAGRVTVGGVPAPLVEIVLTPDKAAGNSGPVSRAKIVDGKFRTASDRGVLGGPYLVSIRVGDGVNRHAEQRPFGDGETRHRERVELPRKNSEVSFEVPLSK